MDLALVVVAPLSSDGRESHHARIVRRVLGESRIVETIDLVAEGVTPAMSRTERIRYETGDPIVDPLIAAHADLVARAQTIVFVFPTMWWSAPPILKAWMERTFVPGVAFTLDAKGKVRPDLRDLRALAGVTTHERSEVIGTGGDGARRMLLRTMRLTAPRRVRAEWLVDADDTEIESRIGNL